MRRSHAHPRVPSKPAFESPNGARLCLKGQSQPLCPGGSIGMNPDATALADMLWLGLRAQPRSWPPLCIALPSWDHLAHVRLSLSLLDTSKTEPKHG